MKKTYYLLLICLIFNSALFAMTDRSGEIMYETNSTVCLERVVEQAITTFKRAKRVNGSPAAPIQYIMVGNERYGVLTPPVIDRKVLSVLIESLEALIKHPEKSAASYLIPLREISKNGKKFDCGIIASSDKIQNVLNILNKLLPLADTYQKTNQKLEKAKAEIPKSEALISRGEKECDLREKQYEEQYNNYLINKLPSFPEKILICVCSGHALVLTALCILYFTEKLDDSATTAVVWAFQLIPILFILISVCYYEKIVDSPRKNFLPIKEKNLSKNLSEMENLFGKLELYETQESYFNQTISQIKKLVKELDGMFLDKKQRVSL